MSIKLMGRSNHNIILPFQQKAKIMIQQLEFHSSIKGD